MIFNEYQNKATKFDLFVSGRNLKCHAVIVVPR